MKTIKEFDYDLWAVDVEGKNNTFAELRLQVKSARLVLNVCEYYWQRKKLCEEESHEIRIDCCLSAIPHLTSMEKNG